MLAQQKLQVVALLRQALAGLGAADANVVLERPKAEAHGDIATNVALLIAKGLKRNPRDVATAIVDALKVNPAAAGLIESAEVAGPGFINLRIAPAARLEVVRQALRERDCYGTSSEHAGHRVMVEFVSANPTGPLHVGHGRQAALGDSICNLLETQGWQVTREFYYNDAGVQIATLAASVQARLRGLKPGDADWPEAAYNGDYIADIAADFAARQTVRADDRAFTASGDVDDLDGIRQFAVAYLRHEQDLDLKAFGVRFDHYFLESSLYADGRV
ncbi:MAG: arginine--tRNA ligase, partial [Betaproteobacteria bacterium]